MKKIAIAAALFVAFTVQLAYAEDPKDAKVEEKKPDNEISYNVALSSDYRFRGISQSRLQPALSGGADYVNNPTGFYLGTWLSTIKWTKDLGGDGNLEIDLYGGKKGEIIPDVSYDIGVLTYYYPSNHLKPNANTTEIYGQLGYGPAYVKYSSTVTNAFGAPNSHNSGYLDIGANIDVPAGFTVNLHVGHQTVRNLSFLSYTDYKVGVTKDFGFLTGAIAVIGSDAKHGATIADTAYPTPSNKNNGKAALVASISKTF